MKFRVWVSSVDHYSKIMRVIIPICTCWFPNFFIFEKDGSVSNVKVLRGVCESIDAEAVRVVKKMPKWKPATSQKGEPVRVSYNLPIKFTLE